MEDAKEAILWKPAEKNEVQCFLCYRMCKIKPDDKGYCRVRKNVDGKLYSLNYGKAIATNIDPIEKKPFYHFMPGTQSFSFSTVGCNFKCKFCFIPNSTVINDDSVKTLEELFEECGNRKKWENGEVAFVGDRKTITASGHKKRIAKVFRHFYNGVMLSINPRYAPTVTCTPYHEFYVWKNGMVEKVAAENINNGDHLVIPKLKPVNRKPFNLNTKRILEKNPAKVRKGRKLNEKELRKLSKLKKEGRTSRELGQMFNMHPTHLRKLLCELKKKGIGNHTFEYDNDIVEEKNRVKFRIEKGNGVPKNIKINEEFAELLGYYCAEGHTSKCLGRPNSFNVVFSYGKHEKYLINRTKKLLYKIFGIKVKTISRETTITVEVGGSSLGVLFKELCGKNSKNKKVPTVISKSNKKVIKSFLKAYIAGDGAILKENISISTVSKKLAIGVYQLFLLLGYLPSFYEWKPAKKKKIGKRVVNQSILYYVKLGAWFRAHFLGDKHYNDRARSDRSLKFKETENFWLVPVFRIGKQRYEGYVYNMEVEDEHSYITNFIGVGNCQNFSISQEFGDVWGEDLPPKKIKELCDKYDTAGVAYTYTEPTIFMEYALDTAKLVYKDGRYNVFVTNGYMTTAAINEMDKYIDASRIDLKGWYTDKVYEELSGDVKLDYVLSSIKELHKRQHIEIITLVIPGYNDNEDSLRGIAEWIYKLSPDIPLHFIGFYPAYKMNDAPSTSLDTLRGARKMAMDIGLNYVYTGNRIDPETESTYCPNCGKMVVKRQGFGVVENKLTENAECPECGKKLNFVLDLEKYRKRKK